MMVFGVIKPTASAVASVAPRVSPRRQHKIHQELSFSRGLLWGTGRGLLSVKVILGVEEWVL